ncbi:MAG: aminopeptidase [Candidatus Krumholzibacteria bacterium]
MYDPRLDRLARVLVRYSTGVRKGDVVRIRMPTLAEPLALAVYREVLRAGGYPIMRMAPGECQELLARYGSPAQLDYLFPIDLEEYKTINADITAWAQRNTRAMTNVDPKKQAAMSKARKPLLETGLSRMTKKGKAKLRWVGTQYPCHASAQDAEMSLTEYTDFVFNAGMLHLPNPVAAWKKIHTTQQRVVDFLNKADEVRFIVPGGTDIRFGVKGRRWINCDGVNNFPDGEVFTGPIESASEGEIRFNFPAVYQGREVTDVWLRFKAGKVVDADASKGKDFLFQMMDQDKGGRVLGELAIGANYSITRFTRNTLFDEKIGGTVHMALGAAYPETGGKNKSALHWDLVCDLRRGGRIEVDGKVISVSGRFTRATWPQPPRKRA